MRFDVSRHAPADGTSRLLSPWPTPRNLFHVAVICSVGVPDRRIFKLRHGAEMRKSGRSETRTVDP